MSYQPEYFVSPRAPGVRPADPPDYDGITFVYLFTQVLDPWIVPPQLQNVVLVVDNAQGFVAGMSIIIEGAGSFEVVSTDALNRMTVENLGYVSNAAPGASIAPGKITTTSLPGPKGDIGATGPTGPGSTVTAGITTTSPAGQNATVVNSGTLTAAVFDFTIPRGLAGPQGPQGVPGQAYSNTTTAAFTAADPPTAQTLSLQSTTGLFAGVVLNISPIGYYQVTGVVSGTQVTVVNTGTPGNAAAGTVSPSGSPVLGSGPQGPPGISATLSAGNTTTIAPGSQAAVTARGTPSAAIFDFAIPAGVAGVQGPAGTNGTNGAPGTAATLNVGTTTTGAAGTPASVTASGTSSAQVFDFVIPQGTAGATGATGATGPPGTTGATGPGGAPATITVGNTSTLAPGSNATVTQRGTSSAAIFDFGIPQGDQGVAPPGAIAPPGAVMSYAGAAAPTGWLLCDGSAVSRSTYSALYAVIGTTYGTGDGSTTFNLPDARSRTAIGAGQGTGLTSRALAAKGGEETHVLVIAELAAHNHTISITDPQHNHGQSVHGHGVSDPGHTHGLPGNSSAQSGTNTVTIFGGGGNVLNTFSAGTAISVQGANANINAAGTGISATSANNGSGTGHNNMMPFIAFNFIIKT